VHVHISNLAAQSGSSLFLHTRPGWVYDKTETLPAPVPAHFTHLIAEYPVSDYGEEDSEWRMMECVDGFDRWALNFHSLKVKHVARQLEVEGVVGCLTYIVRHVLEMKTSPKLCILERSDQNLNA